ncbi:calcium/sodium antiporter [Rhodobacteraceae bacterium]|nr:calcium/sodium antiporter [Paracoccaceae bacterium]
MLWFLSFLGLFLLLISGDFLVRGAIQLSNRLGVSALLVSLTVVAFGTSAPELIVAIKATLSGSPGLAMGNVVGSNIANILLVLGLPTLLVRLQNGITDIKRSFVLMILASVLFIVFGISGSFSWIYGVVLLSLLTFFLFDTFRQNNKKTSNNESLKFRHRIPQSWWTIIFFLLLGITGLPLGADLLVKNASALAKDYGISDAVIGLTLVAIGTSLPELATTFIAVVRKKAEVVLGNLIGSNIFNLLAIIGITSLISPVPVDPTFIKFDFWIMLGASILLAPFIFLNIQFNRLSGFLFVTLYISYLTSILK